MFGAYQIQYSPQELSAFDYYFSLWGNGTSFPASQAGQWKSSGIPQQALKYIWGECAKTNGMSMTRDEFNKALRMIAMVQQGFDIYNPMNIQFYQSLKFLFNFVLIY